MATARHAGGVEVVEIELRSARWPQELAGLSIVQLSDLHYRNPASGALVRAGVALANDLQPDIVVLTGDYVARSTRHAADCARELSRLRAPHGVFAVLGNHEVWTDADYIARELAGAGIVTLRDERVGLDVGGRCLWLVGIEDTGYTGYNVPPLNSIARFRKAWRPKVEILERLLAPIPASEPRIVLVHNPDFVTMLPNEPIDLVLAGHTHGGQIRLPLIDAPVVPSCFGNRHARGLLRASNGAVCYVNKGIGLWPVRLRLSCRSEVTRIRLYPAASQRAV